MSSTDKIYSYAYCTEKPLHRQWILGEHWEENLGRVFSLPDSAPPNVQHDHCMSAFHHHLGNVPHFFLVSPAVGSLLSPWRIPMEAADSNSVRKSRDAVNEYFFQKKCGTAAEDTCSPINLDKINIGHGRFAGIVGIAHDSYERASFSMPFMKAHDALFHSKRHIPIS